MSKLSSRDRRRASHLIPLLIFPILSFTSWVSAQEISPDPDVYDVEKQSRIYRNAVESRERIERDLARAERDFSRRDYERAKADYDNALRDRDRAQRELDRYPARDIERTRRELDNLNLRIRTHERTQRLDEKRRDYESADGRARFAEEKAERDSGAIRREIDRLEPDAREAERRYEDVRSKYEPALALLRRPGVARELRDLPQEINSLRTEIARLTPIAEAEGVQVQRLDAEASSLIAQAAALAEKAQQLKRRGNPTAREVDAQAKAKAAEGRQKQNEAAILRRSFEVKRAEVVTKTAEADRKQARYDELNAAQVIVRDLGPRVEPLRRAAESARANVERKQYEYNALFSEARRLRAEATRLQDIWQRAYDPIASLIVQRDRLQGELEAVERLSRELSQAELRLADASRTLARYSEVERLREELRNIQDVVTQEERNLEIVRRNLEEGLRIAPYVGETEGTRHGERAGSERVRREGERIAQEFARKDARFRGREDGRRHGEEEALRVLYNVELTRVELDNVRDQRRGRGEGGVRRLSEIREALQRRREALTREGSEYERPHRWRRRDDRDGPRDSIPWDQDPLFRPSLDLSRHPDEMRRNYEENYRIGFYNSADQIYETELNDAIEREKGSSRYRDLYQEIRDRVAERTQREIEEHFRTSAVLVTASAEARSLEADGNLEPGDSFSLDLLVRNFGALGSEMGEFMVELRNLPEGLSLDRGREEAVLVPIDRLTEASIANVFQLRIAREVRSDATLNFQVALKHLDEVVQEFNVEVKLGDSLELSVLRASEVDRRLGENTIEVVVRNPKAAATGPLRIRLRSTDGEAEFIGDNDIELREGIAARDSKRIVFRYKPYYRDLPSEFKFILNVSEGRDERASKEITVPVR